MRMTLGASVLLMSSIFSLNTACADELPDRKPGLWEIAISQAGGQAVKMQQCTDKATDAKLMKMGGDMSSKMGSQCSKSEMKRQGDGFVAEGVCKVGGSTVTSRTEFSGDFSTSYQAQVFAKYDPPIMGMSETTTMITGRWLGACPAGQTPGDMIMPGGFKVRADDLERMGKMGR